MKIMEFFVTKGVTTKAFMVRNYVVIIRLICKINLVYLLQSNQIAIIKLIIK